MGEEDGRGASFRGRDSDHELCFPITLHRGMWLGAFSSVGESAVLIRLRSLVRVQKGPPRVIAHGVLDERKERGRDGRLTAKGM